MSVKIEKLDYCPPKNPNLLVKVTEMGNVVEVQYMSRRNTKQTIQMLEGKKQYVVCSTGEVKDIENGVTRKDNRKGLYKTFAKARALINTNVTDVSKVRWITLTYRENMTDTEKLYKDFKKFHMRFKTYCKNNDYAIPEYIVMMEPQARGAWHCHLIYIWETKAPYIPNADLARVWGNGFVKIKRLENVDNVGAYLTAYLGDMEITKQELNKFKGDVKAVEVEENGKKVPKYFVKGARLDLYPAGFKMIRHSKGIKEPESEMMTQGEANKKVLEATKTFEKTVTVSDQDSDFVMFINTCYYNRVRDKNQVFNRKKPFKNENLRN